MLIQVRNCIVNILSVLIPNKNKRKEFRKKYKKPTKLDRLIKRVDLLTETINKKLNIPAKNMIEHVRYRDNEIAKEIKQYADLINPNMFVIGQKTILLADEQIENIKSIEVKVKNGVYKFRENKCLCGKEDDQIIAIRDRYGSKLITVICKNCGLVRLNPYFDDETIGKFYNTEFDHIYERGRKDFNNDFNSKIRAGNGIIKLLKDNGVLVENKRVYEIGCAGGGILKAFQNIGCNVSGSDYNAGMIESGKLKGLDLMVGGIECFKNKPLADIVILSHVLEHVTTPIEVLKSIRNILQEDGHLFIAVPTIDALRHGSYGYNLSVYFINAHVWYFTLSSLSYVLGCAGFECKNIGYGTVIATKTPNFRDVKDIDKNEYNHAINLFNETKEIFWDLKK